MEIKTVVLPQGNTVSFVDWQAQQEKESMLLRKKQKAQATLFVAGDIMLSRTVEAKMLDYNNYNYCFEPMTDLIKSADIALANLESPIIAGPEVEPESLQFRAPPQAAQAES